MTAGPALVTTALSSVDGVGGVLAYRGLRLEDAVRLPYATAVALLLDGNPAGASDIARRLVARAPGAEVRSAAVHLRTRPPMAGLRALAALVDDEDDDVAWAGGCVRAMALLGPRSTTAPSAPASASASGGYAAAVLAAVSEDVDDESAALLDACFVVHLDHALNPSTLAVRVAASVGSPLSACFGSGLGALEGPLHGGASTAVGALLDDIAGPGDVDAALEALAARKARVPGFGHPVYRTRDPRAAVLRGLCERAAAHRAQSRFVDVAVRIEERVRERSAQRLFPNVDFYAAALYATLGVPLQWHTPLFFAARALGWVAHVREQRARGRVISPEADYDGPPAGPAAGPRVEPMAG
jgi:citrate synthase